jgi:uncharacterized protein YycO
MLWDDGTLIGAVSTAQGPYAAGVQKLTLEERFRYRKISNYRIDLLQLRDEDAARAFAESQVGKPYDWGGVLSIPVPFISRNWQSDERWFCSELLAACAARGNTPLIRLQTNRVTPEMIARCPLLMTLDRSTDVQNSA